MQQCSANSATCLPPESYPPVLICDKRESKWSIKNSKCLCWYKESRNLGSQLKFTLMSQETWDHTYCVTLEKSFSLSEPQSSPPGKKWIIHTNFPRMLWDLQQGTRSQDFCSQRWLLFLSLPLVCNVCFWLYSQGQVNCCVTLSKSFHLSVPQFSQSEALVILRSKELHTLNAKHCYIKCTEILG